MKMLEFIASKEKVVNISDPIIFEDNTDGRMMLAMNCDNCKYYEWYYNHCRKWDCEIDAREVHNCYEPYDTPIRDNMVNYEDRN